MPSCVAAVPRFKRLLEFVELLEFIESISAAVLPFCCVAVK
jgi:hypothetical protein